MRTKVGESLSRLARKIDRTAIAIISHGKILQKSASDESVVRLPSSKEMDSGKFTVNREVDVWDMDLGEMHTELTHPVNSGHRLLIDNWEFQGVRKFRVDAACRCACIH